MARTKCHLMVAIFIIVLSTLESHDAVLVNTVQAIFQIFGGNEEHGLG